MLPDGIIAAMNRDDAGGEQEFQIDLGEPTHSIDLPQRSLPFVNRGCHGRRSKLELVCRAAIATSVKAVG